MECLNQNWFVDLRHAREVIEGWRVDYNTVRPHSSLRYRERGHATGVSPHAGRFHRPSVGKFGCAGTSEC
jgi:hypothetical protein